MKNNKRHIIIGLFLSLLLSSFAAFNLFTNHGFSFHDETQIANLFEYDKVIKLGHFPPRWSPDTHFTYGSPYLEFNYQLPYYIGVAFHGLGFSLLDSYKLVLGLSFLVGAAGIYLLGSVLSGPLVGVAVATLYTFTPYRAVDVYVRGTIGESLAIGFFPWIVLALFRLKNKQNFLNIFLVAISITCLILTHQPSTVFGLPIIIGIFILSEVVLRNYRFITGLLKSLLLSFGLASFYLLPVLFEQKYIKPVLPFNFYDHFPFIKQLIFSKWDYGVSIEGPYDGMSFQIGFANLLVIVLGALLIALNIKKIIKHIYLFSTLLATAVILYLMNIRSSFLWSIFPYTSSIQFPWRLLAIMSLLTALVYLFILSQTKGRLKLLLLVLIPIIALVSSSTYFHPGTIVDHEDSYYLRRYLPNLVLLPGEKVSEAYLDYTENYFPLPVDAVRPTTIPDAPVTGDQPETRIQITQDNPFNTTGTIESFTGDVITINRFFYPGWVVKIDGVVKPTALDKFGAMQFFVPKGEYQFSVTFKDTLVRTLGNVLSLSTIGISIFFFAYNSDYKRGKSKNSN